MTEDQTEQQPSGADPVTLPAPQTPVTGLFAPDVLQDVLDLLQDGIVVVECIGTILLTNLALEALVGASREALIGQPVEVLVPERLRTKHVLLRATYERTPRIHRRLGIEIFARHVQGHEIPVIADLAPLANGGNPLTMAFVRFREGVKEDRTLIL